MKWKNVLGVKTAALLLPAVLLASCGGGTSDDGLDVVFSAPYVSEEQVSVYGETLSAGEKAVDCQGFSFGTEGGDAAAFGASTMKISAMVAAKEIDLMVCDLDNAARYVRSEMFYDLAEIFSQEELDAYSDRLLTFDLVDDEGNPTGEQTPVYGIDVSGNENLTAMMGQNSYGVFLVQNTEDLEAAKEIFWQIVNP